MLQEYFPAVSGVPLSRDLSSLGLLPALDTISLWRTICFPTINTNDERYMKMLYINTDVDGSCFLRTPGVLGNLRSVLVLQILEVLLAKVCEVVMRLKRL